LRAREYLIRVAIAAFLLAAFGIWSAGVLAVLDLGGKIIEILR
jgi:hypothetical protein